MKKKNIKKKCRKKTKGELWDRIEFLESTLEDFGDEIWCLQCKAEEYQQRVIQAKCAGFDALVKK